MAVLQKRIDTNYSGIKMFKQLLKLLTNQGTNYL